MVLLGAATATKATQLHAHDTHANTPLRTPRAKIAVCFTAKFVQELAWANLVFLMELKTSLGDAKSYTAGVCQLYSRACDVLKQQPTRQVVFAALASAAHIEFWRFERDIRVAGGVLSIQRTARQPLSISPSSVGYVGLIGRY